MSFNNPLSPRVIEKTVKKTVKSPVNSNPKVQIYNRLAVELCSDVPNKTKIKKLCTEGQILFSGDLVDLMSTVLFELSEIKKHKLK